MNIYYIYFTRRTAPHFRLSEWLAGESQRAEDLVLD